MMDVCVAVGFGFFDNSIEVTKSRNNDDIMTMGRLKLRSELQGTVKK